MRNKIFISILIIMIVIGAVIGIVVTNSDKENTETDLFGRDKSSYIEIQHKNKLIKITNQNDIDNIFNSFGKDLKRDKDLEDEKGWIYKISAFDENDKCINETYILSDNSILVDGKGYKCNSQIISVIDEISGIERN